MLQVVVWKADREATLAQGPEGPLRCVLRFAEDAPGPKLKEPLNTPFTFVGAARAPVQVSADLRRRMLALKGQFLSEDGSRGES